MAQVTYRGVKYDTNNKTAQQKKEVELTYRGISSYSSVMLLTAEIIAASAIFLTIIYAEGWCLYG